MTPLEQRIVDYLSQVGYQPLKAQALAKRLKLPKGELEALRHALDRLIGAGKLHEGKKGRLRLKVAPGLIAGILRKISSGAGFVIPHDAVARTGDIFIAREDLRDAHTGDEVLVRLLKRRRSQGQRTGRIEEILTRATRTFVGTYLVRGGQGYVRIDGGAFAEPVYVGDPGAKGARPDDKVVIEMLRFPTHFSGGEAVLTEVLGARGEPGVDTLSIIHEFGLPDEFPERVLDEARDQAEAFDERLLEERRDLTGETIITIDPVDARDFDDAISLKRTNDGHWHLGVHIADVSHFVQEGSELDVEARRRGTSVYLPDRVLPMLPEVLSNGLASLQKGKVRFTQSVYIEFSPEGTPLSTEFCRSAINVTWRFAYEEVMPLLRDPERTSHHVPGNVRKLMTAMHELAMILRARRFGGGALELSLREVKLDFDEQGRVAGAHAVEHDESHQIIEEFMLAANIAVAREFSDRGLLFLRRGHGEPDFVKLKTFAEFARALGYTIQQFQSRFELQDLLNEVRGKPHERALNYALLRSMKQAEYTSADVGHYALAVEDYCHFTSPIRRYPDLAVHRLFAQLCSSRGKPHGEPPLELEKLARHCSNTERRAEKAERELTKVKLLTFLEDKVGLEIDALITGVEPFGIFCQGTELPVEGLIHISVLDRDDYFDYDSGTFSLVGRRTGRQYRLGDRLRVSVSHVDVDRRTLEFSIVATTGKTRGTVKKGVSSRSSEHEERRVAKKKTARRDGRAGHRDARKGGSTGERRGGRARELGSGKSGAETRNRKGKRRASGKAGRRKKRR